MDRFICSFLAAIFKVGFRTVAMCGGLVMFSRTELYVVPLLHIATQSIWWPGENWVRSKNHKVLDLQVRNLLLASFVIRIFTVHSVQIANFRKFSFHVHSRYNSAILFEFSNFDVLWTNPVWDWSTKVTCLVLWSKHFLLSLEILFLHSHDGTALVLLSWWKYSLYCPPSCISTIALQLPNTSPIFNVFIIGNRFWLAPFYFYIVMIELL